MATKIKDTLETFLNEWLEANKELFSIPPELQSFVPKEKALLHSLWKDHFVPARESLSNQEGFVSSQRPNLLLHGLDNPAVSSQPAAEEYISIAQKQFPSFLYGTSGAGKTRSVLEHLSRNKGFYFLADDFVRNPGSRDLLQVLNCKLKVVRPGVEASKHDNLVNRDRIKRRISMLLFVRYAVHEKLQQLFGRTISAYEWLLYQLYPKELLGGDLFFYAFANFEVKQVEEDTIQFLHSGPTDEVWSIFVDEAQALLKQNEINFLSQNGLNKRSGFSALLEGFGFLAHCYPYLHYPVFSGTGLDLDQISEQTLSIVGKTLGDDADLSFTGFQVLGVEGVQQYLSQFLDLSNVRGDVLDHVAKWLRGRPRWTAAFVEVYISRQEKKNYGKYAWNTQGDFSGDDAKLVEALDRFLNVMTRKDQRGDEKRRESWSAGAASAYACFERMKRKILDADENQRTVYNKVEKDLEYTLHRYVVGKKLHQFTDAALKILIENGVAAVCEADKEGSSVTGHFDEPIVIQSGINFFILDDLIRDNLVYQEDDGKGMAFERLLLPRLMMEKKRLGNFLKEHLKEGAEALEAYGVSTRSAYGVLCVDTGGNIAETLKWVKDSINAKFEGQVAPFCYPDNIIGPDVIFLLRKRQAYEDFLACIVQSKYVATVSNQQDALRTLVPGKFYHESQGKAKKEKIPRQLKEKLAKEWNTLKDQFVSDNRPCLRLLVQLPAPTTAAATSGSVTADATGPTSRNNKRKKRDWLVVVGNDNAKQLFSEKTVDVIRILKRRREQNNQFGSSFDDNALDPSDRLEARV